MVSNREAAAAGDSRPRSELSRDADREQNVWGDRRTKRESQQAQPQRQRQFDHYGPGTQQPSSQQHQQHGHYGPGGPPLPSSSSSSSRNEREPDEHRERDHASRKRDRNGERKRILVPSATSYFDPDTQNPTQQKVDEFFRQKPVLDYKDIPNIFLSAVHWKKKHDIDVLGDDNLVYVTESIMTIVSQISEVQFISAGHLLKLTMSVVNGLQVIIPTSIHLTGQSLGHCSHVSCPNVRCPNFSVRFIYIYTSTILSLKILSSIVISSIDILSFKTLSTPFLDKFFSLKPSFFFLLSRRSTQRCNCTH